MTTVNLHIYHSAITHESRILKETKSIADTGWIDEIVLIGRWAEGLKEHEPIDATRQIWRVKTRVPGNVLGRFSKLLRYVEWLARILLQFRGREVRVVNCHSIMELPLAPLFKTFKRAQIIYDAHELETETGAKGMFRLLLKVTERLLIPRTDAVIAVTESIADWYKEEYAYSKVYVVRNVPYQIPELPKADTLRCNLDIPSGQMIFLYQGGLEFGRGIEMLLDVFEQLPTDKHMVFMGMGSLADKVQEHARKFPNVHFHKAVPPGELPRFTSSADVGIVLGENVCLSYYLSAPNKMFESLMAGIPVIVSDFPEFRRVVEESKAGWVVAVDRDTVAALIDQLTWDEVSAKRESALQYRKSEGWHNEEQVMLRAYRDLGLGTVGNGADG